MKLQNHVKEKGLKVLIIFEGRDAAGKGGTIKRITEHLNPRGARIVALENQMNKKNSVVFSKICTTFPKCWEIVIFDRSWYNRAGVRACNGILYKEQHKQFLKDVPDFEKCLLNQELLFKYYFFCIKKKSKKKI